MNYWKQQYTEAKAHFQNSLSHIKGVILGFNVNLDKIIEITPEILEKILLDFESPDLFLTKSSPPEINSIEDLICSLINAIKVGKADESLISSKEVCVWIEDCFQIYKTQIGGQAGIMANLLPKIKVKNILLNLPFYSNEVKRLLDPSITITEEYETTTDYRKKEYGSNEIEPISHYVFEFKEAIYQVGSKKIHCKRPNRFIASFDEVNSELKINKNFINYSTSSIQNYSLAVISGFHLIKPEISFQTYSEILKPVITILRTWKEINPSLNIHLELTVIKNKQLRRTIIKEIFPLVDSIGMNEQELLLLLEVQHPSVYTTIKDNLNSINLFEGLLKVLDVFQDKYFILHNLGYYLSLSKNLDNKKMIQRKNSLLLASLFAAVRAEQGDLFSIDDLPEAISPSESGRKEIQMLEYHFEETFFEKSTLSTTGIFKTSNFGLIAIPTIIVESPRMLVGIGDTISLIAVLFDVLKDEEN
ncbi:MAG: ADP-dependent glucokinase/phosphofructokinase [Candidatus Thorarchaeota archaeon]